MLVIRDDIFKAMKRSEITLAIMADFSKAFDNVAFEKVLSKLHLMGFFEDRPAVDSKLFNGPETVCSSQ